MDVWRLGYYIHLLTDILWHKQKIAPLKHESKDIIKDIKQKWRNAKRIAESHSWDIQFVCTDSMILTIYLMPLLMQDLE